MHPSLKRCCRFLLSIALLTALPGIAGAYAPTRVTSSSADESAAIVDWEGVTLYYESNRDGRYHLYSRPIGGGPETQLTFGDSDDRQPSLSWDGTQLAFTREAWWTAGSIHTVGIDGSGVAQRSATANELDADTHPAWSPSGQRLYYLRRINATGQVDIMQVNFPGGSGTVFLALGGEQTGPRLSNDGQRMVFASNHLNSRFNVYDLRIAAPATLTQLTFSTNASDPIVSWGYSPDDTRVLYASQGTFGQSDLYEVTRGTSTTRRVTFDNCNISNPGTTEGAYLPDGTGVCFTSYRSGEGHADLWRTELPPVLPGVTLSCLNSLVGPLAPGESFTHTFRFCNFTSTTRQVPWCRSDLQGWIVPTCGTASVPANGSVSIQVSYTVPTTADFCDTNRITINATGPAGPLFAEARVVSKKSLIETTPAGALDLFELPTNVGHFDPAWSRDGAYIYYTSTYSGNHRIYRRLVTGGPEEKISGPIFDFYPPEYDDDVAFSPSGAMIAFSRLKVIDFSQPTITDIHAMPSDGGTAVRLTQFTQGGSVALTPEWWPDASRVVYVRESSATASELAWVAADGSGAGGILLTLPGYQSRPRISRDGQYLAFGSNHLGGNVNIFECPLGDLTNIRQVTFESEDITPDEYSADGTRLLARFAGYNTNVELVEIDRLSGALLRRLTWDGDVPTFEWPPNGAYSPIDDRIAFSSSRVYSASQIWLLRPGITGTEVCATCPGPAIGVLTPGQSVTVPFRFCNCGGGEGRYLWTSADDLEWSTPQGGTIDLARGGSFAVPITLTAPTIALNATGTNILHLEVTPEGNPDGRISCAVPILFEEPPTAVALGRFEAASVAGGIRLEWEPAVVDGGHFQVHRHEPETDEWRARSERPIPVAARCEFLDASVEPGVVYRYRLEFIDRNGLRDLSRELEYRHEPPLVLNLALAGGPVSRQGSVVQLTLPEPARVSIRILDVTGRVVRELADGTTLPAGVHEVHWEGRTGTGPSASAGVYFIRASIRSGDQPEQVRTVRLVRIP